MTEKPDQKTLTTKLAEVMAATERIKKRGRNEFHKYDYATEADIVEAIRLELASRKIMLFPGILSHERVSVGEKGQVLTTILMEFTFLDGETGQEIKRPWMGAGADKEDKGLYKAMTGAEKYFLMKTFLIPTGDDPEDDKDDKKNARTEQRREPPKPELPKPSTENEGIGARGSDTLWQLARKLHGVNAEPVMRKMVAKYNVKNTADLKPGKPEEPLIEYELFIESEAALAKEKK